LTTGLLPRQREARQLYRLRAVERANWASPGHTTSGNGVRLNRKSRAFTLTLPHIVFVYPLMLSCSRYWQFLLYLLITLTVCELILTPAPTLYKLYSALIGYLGLSVEATLPLPQILSNERTRSCKGFRLSVLANWLAGDAMKMFWFFNATTKIPLAFKLCGIFQACCDAYLGWQYWQYGVGEAVSKDRASQSGVMSAPPRPRTPAGLAPLKEKDTRLE
jgi:PQ loop repeat